MKKQMPGVESEQPLAREQLDEEIKQLEMELELLEQGPHPSMRDRYSVESINKGFQLIQDKRKRLEELKQQREQIEAKK